MFLTSLSQMKLKIHTLLHIPTVPLDEDPLNQNTVE